MDYWDTTKLDLKFCDKICVLDEFYLVFEVTILD